MNQILIQFQNTMAVFYIQSNCSEKSHAHHFFSFENHFTRNASAYESKNDRNFWFVGTNGSKSRCKIAKEKLNY